MNLRFAITLAAAAVLAAGCSSDDPEPAPATPEVSSTDQAFHKALIDEFGITTVGTDAPEYGRIACAEPDPTKAAVAIAEFNRSLTIKQGRDVATTAVRFYCPK